MLAAICSMDEEASSAAAACSVAPDDNCSELADISWLPEETLLEAFSALLTTSRSFSTMLLSAVIRSLISSLLWISPFWFRSPPATALARVTARLSPRLMLSDIQIPAAAPISSTVATAASNSSTRAVVLVGGLFLRLLHDSSLIKLDDASDTAFHLVGQRTSLFFREPFRLLPGLLVGRPRLESSRILS